MNERPRAFDVAQEFVTQSNTRVGSVDQTRYIDHHEPIAPILDNAQYGLQRRKWIVGYLRPGIGQRRKQARLTRIRRADNANVCEQLQFKSETDNLSGIALLR